MKKRNKKGPDYYTFYEKDIEEDLEKNEKYKKDLKKGRYNIDKPLFDNLFISDRLEFDHLRYELNRYLDACHKEDNYKIEERGLKGIPGYWRIAYASECKLKDAGFDNKYIKDGRCLYDLVFAIKNEQWGDYTGKPPYGFPKGTYTVSDDNKQMWIRSDIEAAILALYSFRKLEELIRTDGKINYDVAKAIIYSFLIMIDSPRIGILPELMFSGKKYKNEQSEKAGKPRTRNGMTPEQRENLKNKIIEAFKAARKKNKNIKASSYAERNAEKNFKEWGYKSGTVRKIIKKWEKESVGT